MGHTLAGLSIGVLLAPAGWSRLRKVAALAACVVLANVPDLPFRRWGHHEYAVSHSLFVNLALIVAGMMVLIGWDRLRRATGGWRMAAMGAAAWLSHLLLDSFYNHGRGVAVYWPFSRAHLHLPLPWFRSVHPPVRLDAYTLRIVAVEAMFYGSVLALCILVRLVCGRWVWPRKRQRGHACPNDGRSPPSWCGPARRR